MTKMRYPSGPFIELSFYFSEKSDSEMFHQFLLLVLGKGAKLSGLGYIHRGPRIRDEPFTGVDTIAIQDIQMIILDLKKKGFGILITDHSVREILAVCDQVYIMHKGKILQSGTAQEISNSEIAKKYYLGQRFRADASLFSLLEDTSDSQEEVPETSE